MQKKVLVNGRERVIVEESTIASLLEELELTGARVAVELNRKIVPRDQFADRRLADGDRIEIVTFVGGG